MSVCVCMCVHDCMCTWVSAFALVTREQWKLLLSCGSVLELKLRSSGLAASAFTFWAILPARSWVLNVTLLMKPQFFKVSEKKRYYFSEKDVKKSTQFRIQVELQPFSRLQKTLTVWNAVSITLQLLGKLSHLIFHIRAPHWKVKVTKFVSASTQCICMPMKLQS